MKITVSPAPIGGAIRSIPSKSYAHRQLVCAAFADGETGIVCGIISEDIKATMKCLVALGAEIAYSEGVITVSPIALPIREPILDCNESGSTYRFLIPVAAALGTGAKFILRGRLPERPMEPMWKMLEENGVSVSGRGEGEVTLSGSLSGGRLCLPGNVSSQFITGGLLALPLMNEESSIEVEGPIESSGYVAITLDVQRSFGVEVEKNNGSFRLGKRRSYISPRRVVTEGDWSNSSFWLCGAAASGAELECTGLNIRSPQGDRRIVDILEAMGANISLHGDTVSVGASVLKGAEIEASSIPDLVPAIAVAACAAEGETLISGVGRLRMKESDRLYTVAKTLSELGADIREEKDSLIIKGVGRLKGGRADSHGDHRIAMMAAVAALISEEKVTINGAEAVNKSYPGFFDDLASLGGKVGKERS